MSTKYLIAGCQLQPGADLPKYRLLSTTPVTLEDGECTLDYCEALKGEVFVAIPLVGHHMKQWTDEGPPLISTDHLLLSPCPIYL